MIWTILRISIYIIAAAAFWVVAQLYIANEIWTSLQEKPTHALFVDQNASSTDYYNNIQNTYFTETQKMLLQKFSHVSQIHTGTLTFPFTTISDALIATKENNITTISIESGTYNEMIVLPDNIFLYGDDNTKITYDPLSNKDVLRTGNNTIIFNIDISGGHNAVKVPYATATQLRHLTISDARDFNVLMGKKERPKTPEGQEAAETYEIIVLTEQEINKIPLLLLKDVTVKDARDQGLYLRDGRVIITDSHVVNNGEEGIDLHPHMHTTILNTESSHNGESGLETEVYDNIVIIENSTFDNNIKNGIALITSLGIGSIDVKNSTITNNQKYGLRCAVHKNKPKKPRPFFQAVLSEENNFYENNVMKYSSDCFQF